MWSTTSRRSKLISMRLGHAAYSGRSSKDLVPATLAVRLYRLGTEPDDLTDVGRIGDPRGGTQSTAVDELCSIVVEARFDEPLFPYFFAINPDGTRQILFPESDSAESARKEFQCPAGDQYMRLEHGLLGLIVVGSRRPLSTDLATGMIQVEAVAWRQARTVTPWLFDGERCEPLARDRAGAARESVARAHAVHRSVPVGLVSARGRGGSGHRVPGRARLQETMSSRNHRWRNRWSRSQSQVDRRNEARPGAERAVLSMTSAVVHAAVISLAIVGVGQAESGPSRTASAAAASTTPEPAPKVLAVDDARRVAALEETISELRRKGRLAEAVAPARQVLAIRLRGLGEDHPAVETSYESLASTLESVGRATEAAPLRREALKIRLNRVRNDDIATVACYLEAIIMQQRRGNFAAARALILVALEACRKIENPDGLETAEVFTTLATWLANNHRESDAEVLLRKVLAIHERISGGDDLGTAEALFYLARVLHLQKKDDEAERLCRTAQRIGGRKLGESHPDMNAYHALLISCLKARGKEAEVEAEAKRVAAAQSLDAIRSQIKSILMNRPLFTAMTLCFAPRSMIASNPKTLHDAAQLVGLVVSTRAFRAGPSSVRPAAIERANGLTRGVMSGGTRAVAHEARLPLASGSVSLRRTSQATPGIAGASTGVDGQSRRPGLIAGSEIELVFPRKRGSAVGRVANLERIQAQLPADSAVVAWLDPPSTGDMSTAASEHWACVVRHQGEPAWVKIPGSGPSDEWTADDDHRPYQLCDVVCRRPEDATVRWRDGAGALARQWLAPLEPHLASAGDLPAVTRLIVLPPQALAGVPIETLVGWRPDGQPRYTVTYTPSMLIFVHLREKRSRGTSEAPAGFAGLLAVGDPVFTSPDDSGPRVPDLGRSITRRSRRFLRRRARHSVTLPGTRREVLAIAGLFDHPESLLGSEASEQRLDGLARDGRLREFRFLHLATHGKLDARRAQASALLLAHDHLTNPLAQILAGQEVYDGELSAEQILRTWTLDAELVTISACWSGLGRVNIFGADLGFSHALILKGARSVVLSLWNVDDAATALLMTRFYQNLLGRREGLHHPLKKAEALAEAKTWLRTRTAAEAERLCQDLPTVERMEKVSGPPRSTAKAALPYDHPYYWAAFILIGDPE